MKKTKREWQARQQQQRSPQAPAGATDWQDFQTLVARIEDQVKPQGAVVRCPELIPDKDSGEQREVDATVRFTAGTVPILIGFECRRRAHKQDCRWIEELAQKRQSIGADRMIAVSSSGFFEPAIKKAAALGIELRTVSDITSEEIGRWFLSEAKLTVKWTRIAVTAISVGFEESRHQIAPAAADAISHIKVKEKVFLDERSNEVSIDDLVSLLNRKGLPRPDPGKPHFVRVSFRPDPPLFVKAAAETERVRVSGVDMVLRLANEGDESIRLDRVHEYAGIDGPKRWVGEGRWQSPRLPDSYTVICSRDPKDPLPTSTAAK